MFSLFSGVYDTYLAPPKLNLLIVGANGVGKTALLERLKVTQFTKNKKPSIAATTGILPPNYHHHHQKQKQQHRDQLAQLPESFLPLEARQNKHDIMEDSAFRIGERRMNALPPSSNARNSQETHFIMTKKKETKKKKKKEKPVVPPPKKRGFLSCPAPAKYTHKEESSDDDDDDDDKSLDLNDKNRDSNHDDSCFLADGTEVSMEDINLDSERNTSSTSNANGRATVAIPHKKSHNEHDDDDDQQQQDLKDKSKPMLPLHKIRPTIGMNLGKVEICGAECHVWDVGGKMHDLWSRYYDDCDAVIFVWKIVDDGLPVPAKQDAEDCDDDQLPHVSAAQQIALLEQVREAIPDDVPFMIWGHWFPSTDPNDNTKRPKAYQYNQPYETGSLVPHYHNPLMVAYFGSAKTGHGVRSSIEWLIPLAVRQKKFRDKLTKG